MGEVTVTDQSGGPKPRLQENPETAWLLISKLDYDPASGKITNKKQRSHRARAGTEAGWVERRYGYRRIHLGGRFWRAHRVAWLLHTGEWPNGHIDHRNGIRDDNRISNLRVLPVGFNGENRGLSKNNTSGASGVYFNPNGANGGTWRAQICAKGRLHRLGSFQSFDDALAARLAAKRRLHQFQPEPRELL